MMGTIASQSFKNMVSTYLGFLFGALNILFLYPFFLKDDYFGLIGYLLSTANIMMPLLAFGVPNTFVKFYTSYKTDVEQRRFTTTMFFLPLFIILPVGLIGILAYQQITDILTSVNTITEPYVWTIFVVAAAMAYFEVFYAWSKIHMKTVYGNFLKEVFHRVAIMVLLLMVSFSWLTPDHFIYAVVGVYLIRSLLMMVSAFGIRKPVWEFKLPKNSSAVLKYSSLIIVAASVAVILLDIDKFMLGQYIAIENIAFYNVAVFISMVIIVPGRAMHQITYPITASLMNKGDTKKLESLYKRSSLTLFVVSGLLFLLITMNINELYRLLPEQYSEGIWVVLCISLAKLTDNILGNNNSIIFNSDYYRVMLYFGVFLAVLTIILNMIFIPVWGIHGSAFATLLAFLIYNTIKISFVYKRFRIHPFSKGTVILGGILILLSLVFYFWNFTFHPILNIALKSLLIGGGYVILIKVFNVSDDISRLLRKYL
ncbi:polysaccharide biosynthesis C-terminal domain-containing protein [Ascidiimonas aurantiaca]|uniref:polysaccharide biosynthesis C-terminal domain-containing protein n=1 Tax=Ascidiimonas aurantiaca TaxID=1685432 RepID=UPI0030EC8376